MRELTLALAITVASLAPAQAQTLPAHVPSTYPQAGMFCGVMQMCNAKAKASKPKAAETQIADQTGKH